MITQGNHKVEKFPLLHNTRFTTTYNSRWCMSWSFEESGWNSNLFYSFHVAGVHVIMLGSYTDFDSYSPQYKWLQNDLRKVNRWTTPWLWCWFMHMVQLQRCSSKWAWIHWSEGCHGRFALPSPCWCCFCRACSYLWSLWEYWLLLYYYYSLLWFWSFNLRLINAVSLI